MDRVGGVRSPLAGFWMGLGERPPHQPFPVLFDRLVLFKIRTFNSYVGHGMFLSAPAKKTLRKMRNDHGGHRILFNNIILTMGKLFIDSKNLLDPSQSEKWTIPRALDPGLGLKSTSLVTNLMAASFGS